MRDKCPSKYNYYYVPHEKSFNLDLMLNKNLLIKDYLKLLMSENGASRLYKWSNTEGNWNLMMPRIKQTAPQTDYFPRWLHGMKYSFRKNSCQVGLSAHCLPFTVMLKQSTHRAMRNTQALAGCFYQSRVHTSTSAHVCVHTMVWQWNISVNQSVTPVK